MFAARTLLFGFNESWCLIHAIMVRERTSYSFVMTTNAEQVKKGKLLWNEFWYQITVQCARLIILVLLALTLMELFVPRMVTVELSPDVVFGLVIVAVLVMLFTRSMPRTVLISFPDSRRAFRHPWFWGTITGLVVGVLVYHRVQNMNSVRLAIGSAAALFAWLIVTSLLSEGKKKPQNGARKSEYGR